MDGGSRCPRCGFTNPIVAALNEALLAIGRERALQATLRQIVDAAAVLAGARRAALGIVGESDRFEQFIVGEDPEGSDGWSPAGIEDAPLMRAALDEPGPLRIPDIGADERCAGLPADLVALRSFLGAPLRAGETTVGGLFLFGRRGAPAFTAGDQEAVQMLGYHAVLAIENARLYERSRELTVVEERNRLARELHDAVSQTLFSVVLTAGSVETLIERDPDEARRQVASLRQLAQDAQREMRSLIFELRPAEVDREGLVPTIRKHLDVLRRVYPAAIELSVAGEVTLAADVERELFRIQQEALSNALKHAGASRILLDIRYEPDAVRVVISDDGKGFDPAAADGSRRLGLTSMRERVAALGGVLAIDSAPGRGTTVAVEVPRDR